MHKPARRSTLFPTPGQHAERCPHCRETYVYELEIRCVDCDGPMCPLCVVHVRGAIERRCPACHAEPAEEASP